MKVTLSPAKIAWLRERRVFFDHVSYAQRLQPGSFLTFDPETVLEPYSGILAGNHICTIGGFSYSWGILREGMRIGRYCSIAAGLAVPGPRHTLDKVTTSSFMSDRAFSILRSYLDDTGESFDNFLDNPQKPAPVIGNDVWIGANAVLMPGVTIGDGAVIAAYSVVVKDVAPYTIMGGNPAKPIRSRFSDDLVAKLMQGQWWRYALKDLNDLPLNDTRAFADRFLERQPSLTPWTPEPIRLGDLEQIE